MNRLGRRESLVAGASTPGGPQPVALALAEPRAVSLRDTGDFPNSPWPALVYSAALPLPLGPDLADRFEALFARHGWTGAWRNGLYRTHHYHSTAHEALGVFCGTVNVRLGGPRGSLLELHAGDVLVIPAGVAHKNESQSSDFAVLGAYPTGTRPDMQYGKREERPASDRRIAALRTPECDPVTGAGGALPRQWRR